MIRRTLLALLPAAALSPAYAQGDVKLRDLYNKDLSFSDPLPSHRRTAGSPLPASWPRHSRRNSVFFVLTKMPMAVCPFCEPGMPWPDDILAVYAKRVVDVIPFNVPITVTGMLELGDATDPELGFFSKVRLTDATYARA